jgi:hypothetical protein
MKDPMTPSSRHLPLLCLILGLSACSWLSTGDTSSYPKTDKDRMKERVGKVTGDEGFSIGGPSDKDKEAGKNPLGVNSFLWRATLDTLAFMPLASADPFGGVVITDWYEDPEAAGERFKVNALILDRQLRADSIKVSVFRQKKGDTGDWQNSPVDAAMGRKLEDTVLTRARQLRVAQMGY